MTERTEGGAFAWPEALIGFGLLLFSGVVLLQIWAIPVSPLYAKVGPTVFPYVTAAGLALLAVLLLVQAVRGGWQPPDEKKLALDWGALLFVAIGLFANVRLITWLGFSAASTVMFVFIAYGFGSRRPVRDAALGFAVALVAYFGFAKLLGVNIGAGPVEQAIERVLATVFPGVAG